MSEYLLLAVALVPFPFSLYVVHAFSEVNKALVKENQRLTAAAMSAASPVPAAVYISNTPEDEKLDAQTLEQRAEERAASHPLGL